MDDVYETTLLPIISQSERIDLASYNTDSTNKCRDDTSIKGGWVVRTTDAALQVSQ